MAILFSTQDYIYLRNELLQLSGWQLGEVEFKVFPDGEYYHRLMTDVDNKKVVLLAGTIDDKNTLEMFDLGCGLLQAGAEELHLVIPYYGYATMERAVKAGELVKAKFRAALISAMVNSNAEFKVYLLDLHSEGIPYYFSPAVVTNHLYAKKVIMEACKDISNDFILAAPDAGRAKWVESLANDMGVRSAFVYKQRLSGSETKITGVNAEVRNQTVIIYDDMIRTGGSLMQAAQAYHEQGARDVYAICTHGLFHVAALDNIQTQGLLKQVICTNSHPAALLQKNPLLRVISISGIIFEGVS